MGISFKTFRSPLLLSGAHLSSRDSTVVLVHLRLDITAKREKGLDDHLLVARHAPVHRLNLHFGVRLNLRSDVVLAADVLCLIVLECLLPFCLVSLNFSLGLLLCLLQPPVLPLPGLTHLFSSALLCSKELLDSLGLARHRLSCRSESSNKSLV